MKKRIQLDLDDSQVDLLLLSLSNESVKLANKLEYVCSRDGDETEFNNMLNLRNEVQGLKDKLLNQLSNLKFEKYCSFDKIYHFLKLEHFEKKKTYDTETIIEPIFKEPQRVFDFDKLEQEIISSLDDSEPWEQCIHDAIGREKLIDLMMYLYLEEFEK